MDAGWRAWISGSTHTMRRGAVALVVAMTLAGLIEGWHSYHRNIAQAERLLDALTTGTAFTIANLLRTTDSLLNEAAARFGPAPPPDADPSRFLVRLREAPFVHDMIVVGPDGRVNFPNLTNGDAIGLDVSDREYFQFHKANPASKTLHLAEPVVSRATNARIIPISRALTTADGAFAGVVGAAIDVAYVDRVLSAMNFQATSTAAIVRADGRFLARVPPPDPGMSKVASIGLRTVIERGAFEFRRITPSANGEDRLIGYRPVAPYPLVVTSTLLTDAALKDWRREMAETAGMVFIFGTAILWLATLADRRQAHQEALTDELAGHRERLTQEVEERTRHLAAARAEAQATADRLRDVAMHLEESNQQLEQFAYITSHDMREPLRMIGSYLALIERRLGGDCDAELREFLGYAREGAARMNQQILDLLDYSRIGRSDRQKELVPLSVVVEDVLHVLAVPIAEAGADIAVVGPLPTVMAHEPELLRLFQNLIGNAVKYRAPERKPTVTVSARRDGAKWELTVADNGIGIAPEFFDRIFLIFQRLHTREQYEGTGIGLAICRKIVENHGGRIWLESEPGRGSRFIFTMPAVAGKDADTRAAAAVPV